MCGVIGLISAEPVAAEAARGLVAMENRGRQSSGIITANSTKRGFGTIIRQEGPASTVFRGRNFEAHTDTIAIGHDRYATIGDNLTNDAQPRFLNRPGIAMAHNGQITNYIRLRSKLERKRSYTFATECDVEALLYALGQNLIDTKPYEATDHAEYVSEKLFPALKATMDPDAEYSAIGAYSAVAIIAGHGLLAFKDPRAIRPLCFAANDNGTYAFASETIAVPKLRGYTNHQELGPGEAVFVDLNRKVYRKIIHQLNECVCPFEAVYFSKSHSHFRGRVIEDLRYILGLAIAKEFARYKDRIDLVVPVPKTPIPAAIALSQAWGKPYGGVEDNLAMRVFQGNSRIQREQDATDKFSFNQDRIWGSRVAVVDDSVVRGTNSSSITQALWHLGAEEVHWFSTYPPYIGVCPGGIDVADEAELLFYNRNLIQATKFIGATSLNFLPLEAMLAAINLPRECACLGCTMREYPFDMQEYRLMQELRQQQRSIVIENLAHQDFLSENRTK